MPPRGSTLARWSPALLALAWLAAFAFRALDLPLVFPGDGTVQLRAFDSSYHARVAAYDFVNFPSLLRFDPYIAFPDGAPVPMPPLYDGFLAAVARLGGSTLDDFERTAVWVAPALGALTVVPVFAIASILGGRGLGLAAAFLIAILPASTRRSQIGDLDHHAAVALLGALALWASVALARAEDGSRRSIGVGAALGAALAALVLSWSGSLLYVLICQAALLVTALVEDRPKLLRGQALACFVCALIVAPWVALDVTPGDGAFTPTTLSWLHVLVLGLAGAGAVGLAARTAPWHGAPIGRRLAAGLLVAVAAPLLVLLLIPAAREAMLPAISFVSKTDLWGAGNPEQWPLFDGQRGARVALNNFGWLAFLIPFAVLAPPVLARSSVSRGPALCLFCWAAPLCVLSFTQVRFAADFAPSACVCFALLARRVAEAVAGVVPAAAARTGVALVMAAMLLPGLEGLADWSRAVSTLASSPAPAKERLSPAHTLIAFARQIRDATPDTAGFLEPDRRPEYGVISPPDSGHTLHYYARRATPANNFGPYLDLAKLEAVVRFYNVASEAEAARTAVELRARYAMTFAIENPPASSFASQLHQHDNTLPGTHAGRFRLIVEGPENGMAFPHNFPSLEMPDETIPYKLFEIVQGAVLEARGLPETRMRVENRITTNTGRSFDFHAEATADANGIARVRVPYPTPMMSRQPTRAAGPYHVRFGDGSYDVLVREVDVQEGRAIAVAER